MVRNRHLGIRIDERLLDRIDALAERLGRDVRLSTLMSMSRSSIVRLALLRGVDTLEREYEEGAEG